MKQKLRLTLIGRLHDVSVDPATGLMKIIQLGDLQSFFLMFKVFGVQTDASSTPSQPLIHANLIDSDLNSLLHWGS